MKIAIAIKENSSEFFGNGGHAPRFTIYTRKSNKVNDPFLFESIRTNPRTDRVLNIPDDHCPHGDEHGEATKEHFTMAKTLEDCDYLVAKRVCQNSVEALRNYGIKIKKYSGESKESDAIIKELFAV